MSDQNTGLFLILIIVGLFVMPGITIVSGLVVGSIYLAAKLFNVIFEKSAK
jgi:nitrogen fixation protein FixH